MEKGRAESPSALGRGRENHRRETCRREIRGEARQTFRLADRGQTCTIEIRIDNSLLNLYILIAPS
jgi:hypothetical protein